MSAPHIPLPGAAQMRRWLWQLDAVELVHGFARGDFMPSDALESVRERQAHINPCLNAVIHDMTSATAAARAADARYAQGRPLGPLDGVPVSLKDNLVVADTPSTWGTRALADWCPVADERPVARLREAGCILFARTNVPEFTLSGYTDNPVFGHTGNPWAHELTPGGSSGGAVSAVAAGIGPLALGTDGGGSIRRPAAHCGLVGYKPSIGRIPRAGGFPSLLLDFEVVGPMGRAVADVAAAADVLATPTFGMRPKPARLARIVYVERFGDAPVDPQIRAQVRAAVDRLSSLGYRVEEQSMPLDIDPIHAVWTDIGAIGLARLAEKYPDWLIQASAGARAAAASGAGQRATHLWNITRRVATLRQAAADFFDGATVMVTPSIAALSWPRDEPYPGTIDGIEVGPRGHAVYSGWVNAAGLPAINLPAAPSADNLPIGFQLVGGMGDDALLFDIARDFEAAAPWQPRFDALWQQDM